MTRTVEQARIEELEAILASARAVLFAYTDNEITSDPWWAIVRNGSFGRQIVEAGPFFSRERAEEMLEARRYAWGKKAYVFCFSGYYSSHYKQLRAILKPAAATTVRVFEGEV